MHFRMEGKTIELTEQQRCEEDFVIFGVRACDIQAFKVLDKVFLSDPVDTYYAARRERGAIVALACDEPAQSCFCKNFGVDPANPEADIVLWKVGDDYYCDAYTDKGRAIMANWDTEEADAAPVEWLKGEIAKKYDALPFAKLNLNGFDGDHLMEKFNSPKWKKALHGVSGLRQLHLCLPHLPVLRHQGLRQRPRHPALSLLGQLHVFRFHHDGARHQPPHAAGALSPEVYAQAGVLPGQQRRHVFLRGLRPLRAEVPHEPEYREGHKGLGRG